MGMEGTRRKSANGELQVRNRRRRDHHWNTAIETTTITTTTTTTTTAATGADSRNMRPLANRCRRRLTRLQRQVDDSLDAPPGHTVGSATFRGAQHPRALFPTLFFFVFVLFSPASFPLQFSPSFLVIFSSPPPSLAINPSSANISIRITELVNPIQTMCGFGDDARQRWRLDGFPFLSISYGSPIPKLRNHPWKNRSIPRSPGKGFGI